MIRKWFIDPAQEQRIVERLDHGMADYMAALRAIHDEAEAAKQGDAARLAVVKTDSDEIQEP